LSFSKKGEEGEVYMSDAFDQRRKGLEEEYFHRKNKEAIEKLREKMKVSEEAKAAGTSSMKCPRCDGTLKESKLEDVSIDTCEKCGGVWLDSGELEQLTKRESGGFFSRLWSKAD
jgi:uncharacterized protein